MKKLLLTSEGLTSEVINKEFLRLLRCPIKQARVAFISTAANVEKDQSWVKEDIKEIKDLGIDELEEIDISKITGRKLEKKLKDKDVVWLNGGNTFYLLYWIKKSGLDKFLPKLLEKGVLHVGVSAGSIVAGPDIDLCYLKGFDDPSVVKLKNTKSLNFVPFTIFPHYEPKWKKVIEKSKDKLPKKLAFLTDNQAVVVEGKKYKTIGK